MYLLVSLLLLLLGTDACMRSRAVVKLTCPGNRHKTADKRSTTAMIAWDRNHFSVQATRPINGIYQTVPIYGASVTVNKAFYEGTHYIEYKAVDDAGTFDSCSFHVTVNVIRCQQLHNPQFGVITCDASNLFGSKCIVSCIPGYSIVGSRQFECKKDGQWSEDIPFCRTTTCPDPGTPLHGTRLCTTATHAYGSICSFACSQGYQLLGNSRLICRADGDRTDWSSATPMCKEITPPKLVVCPKDIQVTTSTALTELQKPWVLFRSEDGLETPHTCTHFGDRNTYNFTIGTHVIKCKAFDPVFGERAVSVCEFTVKVKPNPCRVLPQPLNGFMLCSLAQGGGSSLTDTTCRLFCNNGYALPRADGPMSSVFECDHTGTWQPSDHVPSCVRPKRPQELKLPSEIYYSSSNCTELHSVNSVRVTFRSAVQATIRMQQSCALNPGDCIVEDVVANCRDLSDSRWRRFIADERRQKLLEGLMSSSLHERPDKRSAKPAAFTLPVQFHFATRVPETGGQWPDEYHRASNRLFGMFDYFERLVIEGTFTIRHAVTYMQINEVTDSLTYAPVKAICDIGYKFNPLILLCVPCGAGTYYNIGEDRCIPCRMGTFQNLEGQFRCKPCPHGTTSVEPGAMNVTQCLDIDDCESNPCLHNGRCIDGQASYTCSCLPGYSGSHCERRVYDCSVHSCQNGGTCMPQGESNYTCRCRATYSGAYCQYQTVDGGWTPWSDWTECSKSCARGTATRNRTCTSPEPSYGGRRCDGAVVEMRVCNEHDCPKCKRLRRPYQGTIKCTEYHQEDYISCSINCQDGFGFSGPVFSSYGCGRNTSYLWPHESPDNPRCVLPACTKISLSDRAKYEFATSFPMQCDSEETLNEIRRELHKRAAEVTSALHCLQTGTCALDEPEIQGCGWTSGTAQRYKRGTQDKVSIKVAITYHGEISTQGGVVSQYKDTVSELSSLGTNLINQTTHGDIYLMVEGSKVLPDPSSSSTSNTLVCPPGMVQAFDGTFCVECSPGWYYDALALECTVCEAGTYQSRPAQTACLTCPSGMTTYGRGAVFPVECYKKGTAPPSIPEDYTYYLGLNDGSAPIHIIVPVVLLVTIATATGIVVFFVLRKRIYDKYNVVTRHSSPTKEVSSHSKFIEDIQMCPIDSKRVTEDDHLCTDTENA